MEIIINKIVSRGNFLLIVLLIPLIATYTSCKKLVESPPPSESIAETNVYSVDATAITVLNGLYISMNGNGYGQPIQGNSSITLLAGLSADELTLYSGVSNFIYLGYYKNALSAKLGISPVGSENWSPLYNFIFKCNAAIEGLSASTALTPLVKWQLLGEAKFMRAFFYFYLVNLFGDVPLVLTTDPEINTLLSRSSQTEVFQQIIADLQDAEENLSSDYLKETLLTKTTDRVRPTKWAARALLARVYLYIGDYAKSEEKSTMVINNTGLYSLTPLNNVFLKNSKEAIWQIQPTDINFNTQEAQTLIIPQEGPNETINPVYLNKNLLKSFEPGDQRAVYGNWIDTTIYQLTPTANDTVAYVNKYKLNMLDATITSTTGSANINEYFMVLRLGEQYLIRSEARAQQGNIIGAQADLNAIRSRAFSTPHPIMANDKASLLTAILHERQVELFCEWAHRWFDLKRMEKIDEVMKVITPLKANGDPWQSYQQLYPLPKLSDLDKAPNLKQNEGYF